ncbi:MAG TPA: ABC transporter ATP-binding protein [Terriglobales bacterium]|nr:ABC transporter ATP-binding protein [Terriglobales bacterium]
MASTEAQPAPVVRAEAVSKRYGSGSAATEALRSVTLAVAPGEFVAIMGRSGGGKTTLLNLLGGMDLPTAGAVYLDGHNTASLSDDALTLLRRRTLGFVFQAFHLLPTLTVAENIAIPLWLAGAPADTQGRVAVAARRVGLADKLSSFPNQLSGGEAQRVAVARALIHAPRLVLADEPTGNLDTSSAAIVIDLLHQLSREQGSAVVLVTHSAEAARHAHRTLHLGDGALADTEPTP